jgi:hypothetical protein
MADWVGEPSGGSVSLFTDFGAASLGEASAELLLKANQSGNISNETMFEEWKRRAILSPELEWMDEQERIEGQAPALGMVEDIPEEPTDTESEHDSESPELAAITSRLSAIESLLTERPNEPAPAPIFNFSPPNITIEGATINVPEQPAPIVNISPAAITVESPVVNVTPAPVNVTMPESAPMAAPSVTLNTGTGGKVINLVRDAGGSITGATVADS